MLDPSEKALITGLVTNRTFIRHEGTDQRFTSRFDAPRRSPNVRGWILARVNRWIWLDTVSVRGTVTGSPLIVTMASPIAMPAFPAGSCAWTNRTNTG